MLLSKKKKKYQAAAGKGNRILINITVIGSAGPIRLVVNEGEHVAVIIDSALKCYAREGRLPILGSDVNNFVLHSPVAGTEALSPWETIGSPGVRNFILCKKPEPDKSVDNGKPGAAVTTVVRKRSGSWKAWFNKSLNLNISSH